MAQIGESKSLLSQITAQTVDPQGNQIISSSTEFGASPAGAALLTQQLFGLANATFQLTPPDVYAAIGGDNQVPYWRFYESSDGVMSGTAVLDGTTNTWGIELTPGTAITNDFMSLSTRSYLINDDNLDLRQRLLTVISKSGTAGGTASQWNLTLSATYYDYNDTALSTAFIGTVYDTGTWTSMSGTTTPGGSAINAAARYVDVEYKLTATATVTGSAKVTIKSCLLSSSAGGGGGAQSFLVTETFTSNGTWTRPTGVNYLVAAVGRSGGGGAGGGAMRNNGSLAGAGGGAGGNWFIIRDLDVSGTANASISIGIGAGGSGGTATTFTKASGSSTTPSTTGTSGSNGGDTTIGTLVTIKGGGGGGATSGTNRGAAGTVGGSAVVTVYGGTDVIGGLGGTASVAGNGSNGSPGGFGTVYSTLPYTPGTAAAGGSGGATSGTGGTRTSGTAGTSTVGIMGGGGGGGGTDVTASVITTIGNGGSGVAGGGGAGANLGILFTVAGTFTGTAGNGGAGTMGGGGGPGGHVCLSSSSTASVYNNSVLTLTSGAGGAGGAGFVTLVWIA